MIGAFRQQTVDEGGVDAVGREHRVGDALRRVLIVVEAGGAERQIEIGDDRIELQIARDGPSDIVSDRCMAPTPPLAPTTAMMRPTGLASGAENSPQIARTTCERADRRDQVVADAPPHEFAIEFNVVGAADDDDAGAGVAHLGELVEAGENFFAAIFRFQHDDVRCRSAVIGLDRGSETAHLNAQMGLGQAPVLAGRLDGGGGFHGFAERLDRDARRRSDLLVAPNDISRGVLLCVCLLSLLHQYPASLSQVGDLADRWCKIAR